MRVIASVLQLVGLLSVTVGAVLEFGISGACVAVGAALVYVGLALER